MAWWVYKCNNTEHDNQVVYGNWDDFFADPVSVGDWGTTEFVPSLSKVAVGDRIIAYQTDRNELVGLAEVARWKRRGRYRDLYLKPIKTIGVKIRPLKKANANVAAIPAFRPGPIMTVYEISDGDVRFLLEAAGVSTKSSFIAELTQSDDDAEIRFVEGEQRATTSTNRNPKLRSAAKHKWGLKCYCCGFHFEEFYGNVGKGCGIVHHLELFNVAKSESRTATVSDVRVVCANCHYIIHTKNPPIDVDDLKDMITARWKSWTKRGLQRKPD